MNKAMTVYPVIVDSLLSNPGIGFTSAPGLMDDIGDVFDNRGEKKEKYKFTQDSRTYNHPDSKVYFCSARWRDIEIAKGVFRWEVLEEKLEYAKSMGCTAVVRCSPYALSEEDDIPEWFRAESPEEPDFPFWRVDPETTRYVEYWSDFIKAFAKKYDGHPVISSIDLTIVGAWGEGGGTEFLEPEAIQCITDAYLDGFKITPLQALLHDPLSMKIITDRKAKVGFRVDCLGDMGGFHGKRWSHMTDFYPQNIQNFKMENAWEKAPILFEACWHMNDWYIQGWDIDYIIQETLKWHISSFNNKGTIVPEPWKDHVKQWLNKMGYRFELRKFTYDAEVEAGGNLDIAALWANVGVAPIYNRYPLVLKLTSNKQTYTLYSREDIREWLPDEDIAWEESFSIPSDVPAGEYHLEIGIETGVHEIGNVKLAIDGNKDGYYEMGKLLIKGDQ
ncbi:DUF4832 domain-containing protein [Paenibacillus sp. FSL A5-0031]|uniref:DUF4832 domain-containing protein n=1 Tax=Paenibacillus sp. FSL A5-0031 TaxID=1920420 RepID=UPI00096D29CC|nr:DUF4832 domain-containing protein [Paenibacillus sp. FSL A5-0031]OME87916.1 DUF4832 domain-containing protein [Paenibacillus sp. FSL A5-0031]